MPGRPEPLISRGVITAAGTAVLGLLVAFGLPLTDAQQAAILAVLGVLAPVVVALLSRPKVTPLSSPRANDGTPLIPVPPAGASGLL